jgi:hypothetical protein
VALAAACGRSGATTSSKCEPFQVQELNATTRDCLGPPIVPDGLHVCHDPNIAQAKGVRFVCVVDADGRVYRGSVSGTEWLEGSTWTHSELADDASTLAPADEARCAPVLATTTPACS